MPSKTFSLRFGKELDIHPLRQFAMPDNPEVFVLSNKLDPNGKPIGAVDAAQYWHSDLSYTPTPSRVSLLYALEVPYSADGQPLGDTEFSSASRAYADLPADMKARLQGLRASHLAQKPKATSSHLTAPLDPGTQSRLKEVLHPVVRTHPYTGKKCLFVNQGFTVRIEGMSEAESEALLEFLYRHLTQPKYIYRHRWAVGDLVMWDNCSTIHQGIGNYKYPQQRLMHRTIVKGGVPY
jgi:taurine dioxygenase